MEIQVYHPCEAAGSPPVSVEPLVGSKPYSEQLLPALHNLLKDADEIGEGDDFDPSMAQSVCRRGRGLAGVITHIYDLLGWTVVRELTFPEYTRHFHEKARTSSKRSAHRLLSPLGTATIRYSGCCSRTGKTNRLVRWGLLMLMMWSRLVSLSARGCFEGQGSTG